MTDDTRKHIDDANRMALEMEGKFDLSHKYGRTKTGFQISAEMLAACAHPIDEPPFIHVTEKVSGIFTNVTTDTIDIPYEEVKDEPKQLSQ